MSVINPLWLAALRRHWPLAGAIIVFLVFLVMQMAFFEPAANRYKEVLKNAESLGLPLESTDAPQIIPPRVYAMLAENAISAGAAREEGESGSLSATLIEGVSKMAAKRNMSVIVAEPAPTSQQTQSIIVRVHVRARCTYDAFLGFLQDLAAQDKLLAVERFSLQPTGDGSEIADLYVSRYVLKQMPRRP